MAESERKRCFVVGPIGGDESDERIHADWLLEEIIQPVFDEHFKDFDVTRADKIAEPGQIDAQVIEALLDSELVIADMTTLNPNAFYEIGIRHMVAEPIIHMNLEGEKIPFDVGSYRSIKFSRKRPRDLKEARAALENAVNAALKKGHRVDNPVTAARGKIELRKTASSTERLLMDELQALKLKVANMESRNYLDLSNLHVLSAADHRELGNRPPEGFVRFELHVATPFEESKIEDLLGSLGIGSDLFNTSGDETWRSVDVPAGLVNRNLLRTLSNNAKRSKVKVTAIAADGSRLLEV